MRSITMVDALYDLIGGRQTVWAATDSFYRRVLADESVSHFFKTTDMGHLLARQSMFISMLLGGRVVYIYIQAKILPPPMHSRGSRD